LASVEAIVLLSIIRLSLVPVLPWIQLDALLINNTRSEVKFETFSSHIHIRMMATLLLDKEKCPEWNFSFCSGLCLSPLLPHPTVFPLPLTPLSPPFPPPPGSNRFLTCLAFFRKGERNKLVFSFQGEFLLHGSILCQKLPQISIYIGSQLVLQYLTEDFIQITGKAFFLAV
jgi:hypothetical protein